MPAQKILIVDDEEDFAEVLSSKLTGLGYQTTIACNGLVATEKAALDQPDLILLDYNMPAANGADLQRRLQFSLETRETPIIFISGVPDIEKIIPARSNIRFLPKPVDMKKLARWIRELLETSSSHRGVSLDLNGDRHRKARK